MWSYAECAIPAHSFAIGISSYATNEKLQKLDSTDRHLNALMERVVSFEDTFDGLEAIEDSLMEILSCDGLSIVIDDKLLSIGDVMPNESLAPFFSIGTAGVLIRRNAIIIFMSVELMLNCCKYNTCSFLALPGTDCRGNLFSSSWQLLPLKQLSAL